MALGSYFLREGTEDLRCAERPILRFCATREPDYILALLATLTLEYRRIALY